MYPIRKKICYVVLIVIDDVLTFKSPFFTQFLENRGADKDIYIIQTF